MSDDWDLHAVVRGCTATAAAASSRGMDVFHPPSFQPLDCGHSPFFPDPFEPRSGNGIEELEDLFKPFVPKLQPLSPQNSPISPLSVLGGLQDFSPPPPQPAQPQQKYQQKQSVSGSKAIAGTSTAATAHNPSPRSKRRKNQLKRVCQVPAEGLSSDMWSWRKYGQKPIKGSPYPRGYYRCSTSKGCLARKQVERNRSDPGMFIVTYTAEHNHPMPTHRNSLAGSTRQKPATPQTVTSSDTSKPSCSSPVSPASLSPATEKKENRDEMEDLLEDEDDELGVSDMVIGDDFFEGLEVLTAPATGEPCPDHLPTSLPFPWLTSNATTTAASGG